MNIFLEDVDAFFKWFIPVVCDCNIKYQKDIGWVRQNTTLYYGVGCPKGTTCFCISGP